MNRPAFRGRSLVAMLAMAAVAVVGFVASARAYTPDSEEVKQLVGRGVAFLQTHSQSDTRMGAQALVGLVMLKQSQDSASSGAQQYAETIRTMLRNSDAKSFGHDIYSTGLAAIFLIEYDADEYHSEIDLLLKSLVERQKSHGGWGYPDQPTGDTSMTQYAVLSYWTAVQHGGFHVPVDSIERVAVWLLKTQDPNGAFGYQGTVSPSFVPVAQQGVRPSMAAAGLGSVYICSHMLGLTAGRQEKDATIAPALKLVVKEDPAARPKASKTSLDPRLFRAAEARGNEWFVQNYDPKFHVDPKMYTYYYMYALERYMSFRYLAEGKVGDRKVREPKWYDDGVAFLTEAQEEDGHWDKAREWQVVNTCFALLFLLRSSGKAIDKVVNFGEGDLLCARGLPKNTDRTELRDGKVVEKPLLGPAQELLAALEEDKAGAEVYERMVNALPELPRTELEVIAAKHKGILQQLAQEQSGEARLAAVRTMAKTRDFDYVPILIYALTDPDPNIAREARDALRRFARKPKGFGMPDVSGPAEREAAAGAWKQWYLAIRPDAQFKN